MHGDFTLTSGAHAVRELVLTQFPDVDGIFIASDLMAAGALGVLAELGRTSRATSRSSVTTTSASPPRRARR